MLLDGIDVGDDLGVVCCLVCEQTGLDGRTLSVDTECEIVLTYTPALCRCFCLWIVSVCVGDVVVRCWSCCGVVLIVLERIDVLWSVVVWWFVCCVVCCVIAVCVVCVVLFVCEFVVFRLFVVWVCLC